jgi:hypothetical protein
MRFLLGVLAGYSMRGKKKLLITVLATVAFIVYIILPAIAFLALRLDVQQERQSRTAQTRVPALKGLSYENAETKLHAYRRDNDDDPTTACGETKYSYHDSVVLG